MTITKMDLLQLLRNADGGDIDLLREGVRMLAQALMEAEVSAQVGAERGEHAPDQRTAHRNGYRDRDWDTRVGTIELAIPKLRTGSYYPSILDVHRRAEKRCAPSSRNATWRACRPPGRRHRQSPGGAQHLQSQVSRICADLDDVVQAWRNRPLDSSAYPFVWIDALYVKVRAAETA